MAKDIFPTPNEGKHYVQEEDDFIKREYGKSPTEEIAKELGRKTEGIKCRARKIGLTYYKEPTEEVPEGFKFCRHCEKTLSLDEFCSHAGSKDGKNSVCKSCTSIKKSKDWQEQKAKRILSSAIMEEEEIKRAMAELSSQVFTCRICKEEKLGSEYPLSKRTMKLETRCKKCKTDNNRKTKIERIKNGSDW